jgi:superfamily I DNA/RNA helicase
VAVTATEWRVGPGDWSKAVADVEGPQLVVAGPGTGKTEFLVQRALHLIRDRLAAPGEVLLLTFSRRAAAELGRRIADGLRSSHPGVAASTFHSFGYRLLEKHAPTALGWTDMPSLLTGPEQVALVGELLSKERTEDWPASLRGLLDTRTFAEEVTDFLLRAREFLLGESALAARCAANEDWVALPAFDKRYRAALTDRGRIDYGTLLEAAVETLQQPEIRASLAAQHRFVLVDEYQDTTTAQARMLQLLTADHRRLTAAADPYQSVYSFRGAELQNVERFTTDFLDGEGRPARRLILTDSFRVPAQILAAAERITAGGELPGAAGPVTPAPHAGRVEAYLFAQQSEEAEWVAREIHRLHLVEGLPYTAMAVLVRTKRRFLPELSRALRRSGIPHDPPDSRLVDHAAVRVVFDCAFAARHQRSKAPGYADESDRAMRRLLLGPLFTLPLGVERELLRERVRSGLPWSDVLRANLPEGGTLAALLDDPSWLDMQAAYGFWHLWTTLPQFATAVTDPGRGEERAAWAAFAQALERQAERDPGLTLAAYLDLAEQEEFEATPLLSYRPHGEDRLTLTTLHQAKGLEFDVVFLADAVEGVFPDLRRSRSLLRPHLLSPDRSDDPADVVRFRLQEEMRLAYTAMTRARTRVVWTATRAGIDEGERRPSRFLIAAGNLEDTEAAVSPPQRDPITPAEHEAALRRLLLDPSQPTSSRLAAASVLAAASHPGMRPATEFAFVRRRGPDTGLVPDDLRLSPSQADSYVQCPRRYAFERRLGVGNESSLYAAFGTLIHLVLERTEEAALEEGLPHGTVEEARKQLDRAWPAVEGDFGAAAFAAAWRRRAEVLIDSMYGNWIRPDGAVVANERSVALRLAGVDWIGRIDRIESIGAGRLRLVDYKTTKSPMTYDEAAEAMQLGFYLLAAESDPEISALGAPLEAEFWYPADDKSAKKWRPFKPESLDSVGDRLAGAAVGIRAEDWEYRAGPHCRNCRVRVVCPAWPEGREAYAR